MAQDEGRNSAAANGSTERWQDADDGPYERKDVSYFQYYSLLSHQAQMLQDAVRTSAYQRAIMANAQDWFKEKVVIDVGAGNGILSIFSAQAGARKVYAVEASNMVQRLQHLIDVASGTNGSVPSNEWLKGKVLPVHAKMEDVTSETHLEGNQQCDTLISECLGVLLVHERMCESFLDARDRFLKPGGAILPSAGTICLAPMEDKLVWEEAANKARFWDNHNFYGVDMTPFTEAAWEESFSSPVVGCFGPGILLAPSNDYEIDFATISKDELMHFEIPLDFEINQTAVVHGLAGWFDLHFIPPVSASASASSDSPPAASKLTKEASHKDANGGDDVMAMATDPDSDETVNLQKEAYGGLSSQANTFAPSVSTNITEITAASALESLTAAAADVQSTTTTYMSTSPYSTPTHWQQVRFLFQEPLAVNKGQRIQGKIRCEVNEFRSYTLEGVVSINGTQDALLTRKCQWRLDRQVYSWTSASPSSQ